MEMVKRAIIKFLIILISFCFIESGISLLIFGSNLQNPVSLSHTNDIEIPHQGHLLNFIEEDEGMEVFKFDTSCFNLNSDNFLFTLNFASQEFPVSIWQPPKFV
jgi:hypothetical protein